jgi:CRP-like cAMP-binding protein
MEPSGSTVHPHTQQSIREVLTIEETVALCGEARRETFAADEMIFEESAPPDKLYLVESGEVSVLIRKYLENEEIARLQPGQCLGEMGVINDSPRSASAVATKPTTLLAVNRQLFERFLQAHPDAARRIHLMVEARKAELALKESVIGVTGLGANRFHVSMKGDPSLRETVFSRERYYSIVDEVLDDLERMLEQILLERNAFHVQVNFNSGEIHVHTVFDPFCPEIHPANRLVSRAYVERHFPRMDYDEKARIVGRIYDLITNDRYVGTLAGYWQNLFLDTSRNWRPVPPARVVEAIREIRTLRNLEQYYLRNISFSTTRDVIRMQFNCDGTHIVNSEDYQAFLRENLN